MSTKKRFWNFLDRMTGDKAVWIIRLMLMLLSILLIFSSSSRLTSEDMSRFDIMLEHLKIVGLGLLSVILIYNIFKDIELFRKISRFGFAFSLILLIILQFAGVRINGALRFFYIGPLQFHVFEVVKVAMMMYIAWVVDALENGRPMLIEQVLKNSSKLDWLKKRNTRKIILLYIPFIIVIFLVMRGSNTTALFLAALMMITIAVGTKDFKMMFTMISLCILLAIGGYSIYSISKKLGDNPPKLERIGTAINRVISPDYVKQYKNATTKEEKQDALDRLRQPYSARIAIKQGKYLGKGPGQSTQRYVVPDMAEDYMFSFIVEEYGWMSLFVIILYLSLVARGVLIIKNCSNNIFAKCAIFGLVLLISGQAFMHIFVNMDFGLLTGQTLPLLSHGSFAFLCFSIAFGIILSISRIANKGMERESKKAEPLYYIPDTPQDAVSESLSDLDNFESNNV